MAGEDTTEEFYVSPSTIPGRAWEHMEHLSNKVRNVLRRGYLKKTYNDGKLLRGRVIMGEEMENDKLDMIYPVGYVAHVKPTDKTEVFTMDVGADASRRVIMNVVGDREDHPQPDEGEAFNYAPGNKKIFTRHKMKKQQGGGGGGGRTRDAMWARLLGRAGGQDTDGQTKDYGRVEGIHANGEKEKVSMQTEETSQLKADKGIGNGTSGNFDIKAGGATQFEAGKHVRKGTTYRDGDTFTQGTEHATDHVAGGGASVGSLPSAREIRNAGGGGSGADGPPSGTPDGSQSMSASGQPGNISLKGMGAAMGMSSVDSNGNGEKSGGGLMQEVANNKMAQDQVNQQQQGELADLKRRIEKLEALHVPPVTVSPYHNPST